MTFSLMLSNFNENNDVDDLKKIWLWSDPHNCHIVMAVYNIVGYRKLKSTPPIGGKT